MTLQSWLDKGFAGVTLLMGSEGSLNLKYLTGKRKTAMHLAVFGLATGHHGKAFSLEFLEIDIFSSYMDTLVLVLLSMAF